MSMPDRKGGAMKGSGADRATVDQAAIPVTVATLGQLATAGPQPPPGHWHNGVAHAEKDSNQHNGPGLEGKAETLAMRSAISGGREPEGCLLPGQGG